MTWCTVKNCQNAREKGFQVRRFPTDPNLRALWLKALGLDSSTVTKNRYVCQVHFLPTDWETSGGSLKLVRSAVPSVFCTCPPEPKKELQDRPNSVDHAYSGPLRSRRNLNKTPEHSYMKTADKARRGRKRKVQDHCDTCPLNISHHEDSSFAQSFGSFEGHLLVLTSSEQEPSSPSVSPARSVSPLPASSLAKPRLRSTSSTAEPPLSPSSAVVELVPPPDSLVAEPSSSSASSTAKPSAPSASSVGISPRAAPSKNISSFATSPILSSFSCGCAAAVKLQKELEKVLKEKNTWKRECARLRTENRRQRLKIASMETAVSKCLNGDQLRALDNKSGRMEEWSNDSIKKGVNIQLLTSTSGNRTISKKLIPLPSARTVSRSLGNGKLRAGGVRDVFDKFEVDTSEMTVEDFD